MERNNTAARYMYTWSIYQSCDCPEGIARNMHCLILVLVPVPSLTSLVNARLFIILCKDVVHLIIHVWMFNAIFQYQGIGIMIQGCSVWHHPKYCVVMHLYCVHKAFTIHTPYTAIPMRQIRHSFYSGIMFYRGDRNILCVHASSQCGVISSAR